MRVLSAIGPALVVVLLTMPAAAQMGPMGNLIELSQKRIKGEGTECVDRAFRVAFRLPLKWSVLGLARWTDAGELATTINLRDPESDAFVGLYYRLFQSPKASTDEAVDQRLLSQVELKVSQRVREGLKSYQVRAQSHEPRQIGGRRALSCIADYTEGKRAMTEYLTWISSGRSQALFFTRIRAEQLAAFRERLEPIIQTLEIP